MKKNLWWIILPVIILFIFALIYFLSRESVNTDDYLFGLWTAQDDAFCKKSDISNMMLFIGERSDKKKMFNCLNNCERKCYLIIGPDIVNGTLTMKYKRDTSLNLSKSALITYKAQIQFDDKEYDDVWPREVTIKVNVNNGTLKITGENIDDEYSSVLKKKNSNRDKSDSKIVYAYLTKQNEITNMVAQNVFI